MRRSCNYPSQTILNTLKFCNILDSNIMKEGIAVIKSATNKSCCNSFLRQKMTYTGEYHGYDKNSNDTFEKYVV